MLLIKNAQNKLFWAFVMFSALVGIRTPNLLIRSQVLYPIELRMRKLFLRG